MIMSQPTKRLKQTLSILGPFIEKFLAGSWRFNVAGVNPSFGSSVSLVKLFSQTSISVYEPEGFK